MRSITNIIDGKAVAAGSDELRQVVNPSTGVVVAEFAESTTGDGDHAVAAAQAAFGDAGPPGPRRPLGTAASTGARSRGQHRRTGPARNRIDAGKPTTVARGDELPGIAAALRHFAGAARALTGQAAGRFVENNAVSCGARPVGVVLGITPWNFPLWQAVWKLGPALAAGNTVVIKPAEMTPLAPPDSSNWPRTSCHQAYSTWSTARAP